MAKEDKLAAVTSDQNAKQSDRECFVICPIGSDISPERKRSDQLLKYLLTPVFQEKDIRLKRADIINDPGIITNQIINCIINSDIVLADLSDHNPNVFYELAVRHATKKPCILMISKNQDIPFDINQSRVIFYDINDLDSVEHAKENLRNSVDRCLEDSFADTNPITQTLSLVSIPQASGDEGLTAVVAILQNISLRINSLENSSRSSRSGSSARDSLTVLTNVAEKSRFAAYLLRESLVAVPPKASDRKQNNQVAVFELIDTWISILEDIINLNRQLGGGDKIQMLLEEAYHAFREIKHLSKMIL